MVSTRLEIKIKPEQTMDKPLRSMTLEELDAYRIKSIQELSEYYPLCEHIVKKLGYDTPESLYKAREWKNVLVTVTVIRVDGRWSRKQQRFIETNRIVVTYAGTTAVNVLLKDCEIVDEPDWSRAIPGKWQGVVQDVFNQALVSEQREAAEIEKARRNNLISILDQAV